MQQLFSKSFIVSIFIITILFVINSNFAKAQFVFKRYDSIEVYKYADTCQYPFVGGFNNPQFSKIYVNQDAIPDLFVFDKIGNHISVFVGTGNANIPYRHAPEYEDNFPKDLVNFALIRDYNCDGISDIFTSNVPSIKVYKGYWDNQNKLAFIEVANQLYHEQPTIPGTVYVASVDLPAIDDINGDGDLDIISADVGGIVFTYYENQQMEKYGTCNDSLKFKIKKFCWGKIRDGNNSAVTLNYLCTPAFGLKHTGNSITTFDMDHDGDKDALKGNIGWPTLNYLTNCGDNINDSICIQDTIFPNYNISYNCSNFGAAYVLDIDNDGLQDVIASPFEAYTSENIKNAWFYKNVGTINNAAFALQSDSLFSKNMIDCGEGAATCFTDYDNDGLLDLLIANAGKYSAPNTNNASVTVYKNIGTILHPKYKLYKQNLFSVSAVNQHELHITAADINGDGQEDIFIGKATGEIVCYYKSGPENYVLNSNMLSNIDVGDNAAPCFYDMDTDGDLDLIVGEKNGKLNYYKNIGSASNYNFVLQTNNLGNVNVCENGNITGFSVPCIKKINSTGVAYLWVGNQEGHIYLYSNIENNAGGNFTLVNNKFSDIGVGYMATVSAAQLLGSDTTELIIGNYRGGISIYKFDKIDTSTLVQGISNNTIKASLFPNPSSDVIKIHVSDSEPMNLKIYNYLGTEIMKIDNYLSLNNLNISQLKSGLYFIKISNNFGAFTTIKFFKISP